MKRVISIVCMCLIALMVNACNNTSAIPEKKIESPPTQSKPTKPKEEPAIKGVYVLADVLTLYNDIRSLTRAAAVVFEGDVISTSSEYHKDGSSVPYTTSQVRVAKVLNGKVQVGDVLTFGEMGGVTTKKEERKYDGRDFHLNKSEENELVEFQVNGSRS
ncbi:hypothetical protein J2Z48_001990 [Croceifilum oryzae]|uniref:Lipoprotein n=1 Tax=Croceifilum oryzae TaxID=1553429 RepID=A0AAJ1WUA5_9BACL|nr:hypothetical protein [Croceifilum oryzae]MDQ0417806.1 hypothetical protein [Croceifilum oryzae]